MLQLPRPEKISKELLADFRAVREGRRHNLARRSRVELRASSLPICPRAYHIYRRLPPTKRPPDEETFMSNAATLMGTALHLALQKWFGISLPDHAYGNWGCVQCQKIRRHHAGIQTCRICGQEMVYVEYEVQRNQLVPFSGHLDMILRYVEFDALIDFKGAHQRKLNYLREHGPERRHYHQVNAYANAIRLGKAAGQDFGSLTKINKLIIIYVDRGQPWFTWHPVQMPVSEPIYRETVQLIKRAEQSLVELEIPRGFCLNATDKDARWCEWKDLCFSPVLDTILEDKVYPIDDRPQDRQLECLLEDPNRQRTEEGKETDAEKSQWYISGEGASW